MNDTEDFEIYLSRFPTKLHNYLLCSKRKDFFIAKNVFQYKDRIVFRGLHQKDMICDDDFVCNLEEAELYHRNISSHREPSMEMYGVSVNEDINQVRTSLHIPNKSRPAMGIAKGRMQSKYGPADFVVREGIPATHHNWYIYEDSISAVVNSFEVVDLSSI